MDELTYKILEELCYKCSPPKFNCPLWISSQSKNVVYKITGIINRILLAVGLRLFHKNK